MVKGEELKQMAKDRLAEAELMCNHSFFQGAYYIAGYAVEFSLKALICKRLGVDVFAPRGPGGEGSPAVVRSSLQIHDLPALLVFAGLQPALREIKVNDIDLFRAWSSVSEWTEQRRYQPLACSEQTVLKFLKSVKIIIQWVESHY
ncbi:HEPN domain-containing protein [Spirosoma soli]|uniref:HEPN domain-containing protein n=1 Tax=Spirosoma soli TaxID=1770529 RepID=A0ABW5MBD1_9BACT